MLLKGSITVDKILNRNGYSWDRTEPCGSGTLKKENNPGTSDRAALWSCFLFENKVFRWYISKQSSQSYLAL